MIDEDLDEALGCEAREQGTSKAALIRTYVGERLRPLPSLRDDPLWALLGAVEGARGDSTSIDDVVYARRSRR